MATAWGPTIYAPIEGGGGNFTNATPTVVSTLTGIVTTEPCQRVLIEAQVNVQCGAGVATVVADVYPSIDGTGSPFGSITVTVPADSGGHLMVPYLFPAFIGPDIENLSLSYVITVTSDDETGFTAGLIVATVY